MIYPILFLLCTLVFFLSSRTKGALRALLVGTGLFLPCFIAAVRDRTVGTDVMVYGWWTFRDAQMLGLKDFIDEYEGVSGIGFNLLSWIVSNSTHSFEVYLFTLQALTIVPFFLSLRFFRVERLWFGMLIYFLVFYLNSLNLMKQMIAVSICLYSVRFAFDKRPLPFFLLTVVAMSFHQTAIVNVLVYVVVRCVMNAGDRRPFLCREQIKILAVFVGIAFVFILSFGRDIVAALAFLKESYAYQANASSATVGTIAYVLMLDILIPFFVLSFGKSKEKAKKSQGYEGRGIFLSLGLLSLFGVMGLMLNAVAESLARFSFYGMSFIPNYFAAAEEYGVVGKRYRMLQLCLFSYFFVSQFVINGGAGAYPYSSLLLGV